MGRTWRDYGPANQPPDSVANSAISANSSEFGGSEAPNGTNGTNGTALPADIRRGLVKLGSAPAPRLRCPEVWPGVVADALRLANEGWAERALALGWSAFDLFGAVAEIDGDPNGDGLAVWLAGRKLLMLDELCAVSCDANGSRYYFHRPRAPGAVLLWALGHGR